jgi:hypothetical protein
LLLHSNEAGAVPEIETIRPQLYKLLQITIRVIHSCCCYGYSDQSPHPFVRKRFQYLDYKGYRKNKKAVGSSFGIIYWLDKDELDEEVSSFNKKESLHTHLTN